MLKKEVIVRKHPETGAVFSSKEGSDWVSVRVESETLINKSGMIILQKRVAFVRMQRTLAEALSAMGKLTDGKPFPLEGTIIVQESLIPFYDGQEPKINPISMENVLHEGREVYRQAIFSSNESAKDELIDDYVAKNQMQQIVNETINATETVEQTV